jgi:cytochrome c biogenesis protein CcmG/thiol:disulfide interchange protein DsbE
MPETFIIDGRGVIVYKHVGPITEEALRGSLLPALRSAAQ